MGHDGDRPPRPRPASRSYSVGYGKPPVEHQFAPGNRAAANRRRRPKRDALAKVMAEQVEVTKGGRTIKMPVSEAIVNRLVQRALNGDYKALDRLIKLGFKVDVTISAEGDVPHDYGPEIRAKIDLMAERIEEAKRSGFPES